MSTKYDYETSRDEILGALADGDPERVRGLISGLRPPDLAELFDGLEPGRQAGFLEALDDDHLALLLERLHRKSRASAVQQIPDARLPSILDRMTSDDAADVLRGLPKGEREKALAAMTSSARVRSLVQYSAETAGGLMTLGYTRAGASTTARDGLLLLQSAQPPANEVYYYLYIVSEEGSLLGVVNLRELIIAGPETPVSELMRTEVVSVAPGAEGQECSRLIQRYRLRALPVVDLEGVLLGVITADDVIDMIQEEATEDMYRMAGVGVKEWVFSPLRESIIRRVPWLSFNMIWAFAGAAVISLFQGTLEKAAVVAVFMPMIAGQAGNAGIQTATIVVRSMALGEVKLNDISRVLAKEIALAATKGVIFGSALGLIAWLWKGNVYLGLIAGSALFLNMLIAGTAGVLIPMTLRRLGLDPATIAGVFDTMLTDLMGFLIYLGLATIFISQLT